MPAAVRKTSSSATKAAPMSAELNIQLVPRDKVKFWAGNPRRNDVSAKKLAILIYEHGLRSPVYVWDKNNVAYKGNTTLKALDILWNKGVTLADGTIVTAKECRAKLWPTAEFLVPVVYHQFKSEKDAEDYGMADNKASEYSEWDEDVLASMLASRRVNPERTGFGRKEVDNLLFLNDELKMKGITPTDAAMLGRVTVTCRPENKEEVVEILKEWATGSGFEDLIVK